MNWINENIVLKGKKVLLLSLNEMHFDELIEASQHEIIWTYLPVNGMNKEKIFTELRNSLTEKEKGNQFPFVVIEKETNKIIGCTRFLKLSQEHRNLEIGWTWYSPEYWGQGFNDECKLLLLGYCFEVLKTIRVQIVANENNTHSRKAIERIGGKFEGILRNIVLRHDGPRTAAYYSIIDTEWAEVKMKLKTLVQIKLNT